MEGVLGRGASETMDVERHRMQQTVVMGYTRPCRGRLAQILYDMEAFHRHYPLLFKRLPNASD